MSEDLTDLPPSSKLIYRELEQADGPLTIQHLQDRTYGLSLSVCWTALDRLRERDLVEREPTPDNPAQHQYRLSVE